MVDLAALRSAEPGELDRAAGSWKDIAGQAGSQVTALRGEVIQPLASGGTWVGSAADAAVNELDTGVRQLSVTQDYAETMAALLRDAATGIGDAQAYLRAADNLAAENHLTIGTDGSVSAPAEPPLIGSQPASLFEAPPAAVGEVSDLLRRALAIADDVDTQITARLRDLRDFTGTGTGNAATATADLSSAGKLAGTFDDAAIPAEGTSPAEVNAWWKAQSAGQQQRLIQEDPGQVGWLDGVPATARNQANLLAMARDKQQLQNQLASLQAQQPPKTVLAYNRFGTEQAPNPAWQQWNNQVSGVENKLAGISAVESGLAMGGKNGYPPTYLLGFNTKGNGHAIVSFGNPDTADNTITYVPGLGSKITGALGDSTRAARLAQQAENFAPGKSVASIYWLNYNAPQLGVSQGVSNFDTASTSDAVAGAKSLAQFQSGLQATHQAGVPAHTVVLGHSYGSLVVGEAAAHDGLHPNDIIVVGSPGVGVTHASQLGISPSHVWAGENVHDPVPLAPPADPITAVTNPHSDYFGENPASQPFGGQVFNATDGSPSFSGPDNLSFSAHSSYWDPNSDSLKNMAHIVDGQYGSVVAQPAPPPDNLTRQAAGGLLKWETGGL